MAKLYHRPEWKLFRDQIIEHDGGVCQVCKRRESDGIILQVHHKVYHPGVLPWDYDPRECETLCMFHHAEHHEKVRPSYGWDFVKEDDLGDLEGTCEACGTSIRYVFHIDHPRWDPMAVGTNCCDRMTGTRTASELRLKSDRKQRFLGSDNWREINGVHSIERMKMVFEIHQDGRGFFVRFLDQNGRNRFSNLDAAKDGLFTLIDSGDALRFKTKHQKKYKA